MPDLTDAETAAEKLIEDGAGVRERLMEERLEVVERIRHIDRLLTVLPRSCELAESWVWWRRSARRSRTAYSLSGR